MRCPEYCLFFFLVQHVSNRCGSFVLKDNLILSARITNTKKLKFVINHCFHPRLRSDVFLKARKSQRHKERIN